MIQSSKKSFLQKVFQLSPAIRLSFFDNRMKEQGRM